MLRAEIGAANIREEKAIGGGIGKDALTVLDALLWEEH
jgi:hypothetical protein